MKTLKILAVLALIKRGLRLRTPHMLRVATSMAFSIFLGWISLSALAAPLCSFSSVSSVGFGNYDVFTTTANTNGIGQLVIKCSGGSSSAYVVTLSAGQSNNFTTRTMKNGSFNLDYNLYINSSRTTIWGDGTGGTSTMSASGNGTTTLDAYGEIPAGQDVPVGSYSDSITATVTF